MALEEALGHVTDQSTVDSLWFSIPFALLDLVSAGKVKCSALCRSTAYLNEWQNTLQLEQLLYK